MQYKKDRDLYINFFSEKGILYFNHFTSKENIRSIEMNGGIYSNDFLTQNRISFVPGGDDLSQYLDRKYENNQYVHLSICERHPMFCNRTDVVHLKISLEVAAFKDTKFCDMNSNDIRHNEYTEYKDLDKIDIRATQKRWARKTDPDFKQRQAEVLVKTCIPIECIQNFNEVVKTFH